MESREVARAKCAWEEEVVLEVQAVPMVEEHQMIVI